MLVVKKTYVLLKDVRRHKNKQKQTPMKQSNTNMLKKCSTIFKQIVMKFEHGLEKPQLKCHINVFHYFYVEINAVL